MRLDVFLLDSDATCTLMDFESYPETYKLIFEHIRYDSNTVAVKKANELLR